VTRPRFTEVEQYLLTRRSEAKPERMRALLRRSSGTGV